MTEELDLHKTTDASVWAREFCRYWPSALCQIPGQEGVSDGEDFVATMTGWFANAMMAMSDHTDYALRADNERLRAALRPFSAAYYNDNGDVTISTGHIRTADYKAAHNALSTE